MFKHILIPTDGSDLSKKAVHAGITFAKEVGAKVTAYHALERPHVRYYGDGVVIDPAGMPPFEARIREAGEACLAEVAEVARAAGVPCESVMTQPNVPYQGIIDAATDNGCDAIFMASHGYGGLASLVLGSVTQKVLAHTKLPMVVYR